MSESPQPYDETRPCPHCQATMVWTGLPDCSGPIYVRFYRCPNCGVVKVDVPPERMIGWG